MEGQEVYDLTQLQEANRKLAADLASERSARQRAQEALAQAEAERARLQRVRDELARNLLDAERRAQDAEDDQHQAASQLQALQAQLQQQPPQGDAGGAGEQQGLARSFSLQQDVEVLLAELDRERRAGEAAQAAARAAGERLAVAQAQLRQGRGSDPASTAAGDVPAALAAQQQRVAALKGSRDKLIAALDAQAQEGERLSAENAALAGALVELRSVSDRWEAQAQQGLAQSEQLKDLLEESATWGADHCPASAPAEGGVAAAAEAAAAPATPATDAAGEKCRRLEQALLAESARAASLELQVRALCMELTRAGAAVYAAQHAVLPLLSGVEARLAQVLGMKPVKATGGEGDY